MNNNKFDFSINITQHNVLLNVDKDPANLTTHLKDQITNLSKEIFLDINKEDSNELKNLQLTFSSKGEIKTITKNHSEENVSLNHHIRKKTLKLLALLKKGGIFSSEEIKKNPSSSILQTHQRLLSENLGTSNSEFILKRAYKFLLRFFAFHITLDPMAHSLVRKAVQKATPEELKNLYINPQHLFEKIKQKMTAANSSIEKLYSNEELDTLINDYLIKEANNKLARANHPKWNHNTLYHLDLLRIIQSAKNGLLTLDAYKVFSKINPLDIPIEEFATIPVTEENKEILTQVWNNLAVNLFVKGDLKSLTAESNLSGIIVEAEYIQHYLKAVESIPNSLKETLQPILTELNQLQTTQTLRDFLVQRSILSNSTIDLKDPKIQLEQKIYQAKIKDQIFEFIEEKLKDEVDANELVDLLTQQSNFEAIEEYIKENIYEKLTKKEKEIFPQERLFGLVIYELERIGVRDYHMTNEQMINLKKIKDEFIVQKLHTLDIEKALEEYQKEIEKIEKTYQGEEKEDKLQFLQDGFLKHYNDLLNENISVHALMNVTGQIDQHNPHLMNLLEEMWKQAIYKSFEKGQLNQINQNTNPDLISKEQIKPYVLSKMSLNMMEEEELVPKFFSENLNRLIDNLEQQIKNQEAINFLNKNIDYYENFYNNETFLHNELLNNDNVLNSALASKQNTIFSNEQKVCLMEITKLINFGSSRILTELEKNKLSSLLDVASKDKNLNKLINKLLEAQDNEKENVSDLLTRVPWFLRGIAKKFVPVDLEIEKDKLKKIPAGMTGNSLKFLSKYLSKSKNLEQATNEMIQLQDKALHLLQKYTENPQSINPKERLTLSEMGKIIQSSRLSLELDEDLQDISLIGQIQKLGLLEVNKGLEKLAAISQRSGTLLAELDKLIQPEMNAHYKNGDLLAYSAKKKSALLNRPLPFEEQLTGFVANGLTHGAKLFIKEGNVKISHVYGNYETSKLDLFNLCISDVWEIDLRALVPPSMQNTLKLVYGEEWSKKIMEIYSESEFKLHDRANFVFKNVGNNAERRIAAGFADHPFLLKQLTGQEIESHTRKHERDFNKIHGKFFSFNRPDELQICSEWATKATLAAMIETNKQIVKDIHEKMNHQYNGKQILIDLKRKNVVIPKNVEEYLEGKRYWDSTKKEAVQTKETSRAATKNAEKELIKILKKQGFSSEKIQLIIRLGDEEIFDLPYSKKERLKAVHPGRMVKLLMDKKCAKLKSPPKALMALVKVF